jgi:hypothetical protein
MVFVSSTQEKEEKECHPQPDAPHTLKDKTCCYIREVNFANVSFIDSALITKMVCVWNPFFFSSAAACWHKIEDCHRILNMEAAPYFLCRVDGRCNRCTDNWNHGCPFYNATWDWAIHYSALHSRCSKMQLLIEIKHSCSNICVIFFVKVGGTVTRLVFGIGQEELYKSRTSMKNPYFY